jgi:hypothetical protein
MRRFNSNDEYGRTFKVARRVTFIGFLVYTIFAIVMVVFIIYLFNNPQIVGQFFGKISNGFNSAR